MSFADKVYDLVTEVPCGRVTTYKEVARAIDSKAYRAVGNALNRAENIPCHRVVRSDGTVGGYAHGTRKKVELLQSEGVEVEDGRIKDFDEKLFCFD